jgi:hypothetical protein
LNPDARPSDFPKYVFVFKIFIPVFDSKPGKIYRLSTLIKTASRVAPTGRLRRKEDEELLGSPISNASFLPKRYGGGIQNPTTAILSC